MFIMYKSFINKKFSNILKKIVIELIIGSTTNNKLNNYFYFYLTF